MGMKHIIGERFGEERALYGSCGVHLTGCVLDGEEDGESALKESCDYTVEETLCRLRYPFWHGRRVRILRCEMSDTCRAPLWYSEEVGITDTRMHGTKAVRECRDVQITGCDIRSDEFGWFCNDVHMRESEVSCAYFLLRTEEFSLRKINLDGKYSLQYVRDGVIEDCALNTKDALWHAKNVTVKNCTVRGEYLAWYSENLTFVNCRIIGTQPFCYCRGLRLLNCEMVEADLAFERSEVEAELTAPVLSIKNPRAGRISLPCAESLIMDDPDAACEIVFTADRGH